MINKVKLLMNLLMFAKYYFFFFNIFLKTDEYDEQPLTEDDYE